jgi:hypothetical protein
MADMEVETKFLRLFKPAAIGDRARPPMNPLWGRLRDHVPV